MDRQLIGGLASSASGSDSILDRFHKDLQRFNCGYDSESELEEESSGNSRLLLTPHANGTTSEVFRARPPSLSNTPNTSNREGNIVSSIIRQSGGLEECICVKRVIIQGQPKPHDVVREIRCLLKIKDTNSNIIPLLAAYFDQSDPFSTRYDLIFPFYPINLSQLLDEPSFLPQVISKSAPELSATSYAVDPISTAKEISQKLNGENYIPYIIEIYRKLLSALSFLHDSNSIAHRDIKPSNILLSLESQPILTDFGTAWELDSKEEKIESRRVRREEWLEKGRIGDDGEGSILPDVGSGSFRPPELLLSPKSGYDSTKVDIWELGVTICSFFTEIMELRNSSGMGGAFDGEEDESFDYDNSNILDDDEEEISKNDLPEWEKDLFKGSLDERTKGPQEFENENDQQEDEIDFKNQWIEKRERDEEDQFEPRMKSHRITLFDGSRGDIGLMGSIFNIRGLSKDEKSWPEAIHFQPSLSSLPFESRPRTNLLEHLPIAKRVLSPASPSLSNEAASTAISDQTEQLKLILKVIESSLELSAGKRPSAKEALKMFN